MQTLHPDNTQLWFYVAVDYKGVHIGKPNRRHLWERRVFVFRATEAEADSKALTIAQDNEHEYIGATGDTIRWTFHTIESSAELFDSEITDGTEVYWSWFARIDKKPLVAISPKIRVTRPRQFKIRRVKRKA